MLEIEVEGLGNLKKGLGLGFSLSVHSFKKTFFFKGMNRKALF